MSPPKFSCSETVIRVEGLRIDAFVGLHAPERRARQTIIVDIECTLADPEVHSDKIENTVDYVPIVESIKASAEIGRYRLIETFASWIALECFIISARIKECRISIRKPNKLKDCDAVGISRIFTRKEA